MLLQPILLKWEEERQRGITQKEIMTNKQRRLREEKKQKLVKAEKKIKEETKQR